MFSKTFTGDQPPMDAGLVFSVISAAAMIGLILAREHRDNKIKLILGGVAVAAGLVGISLLAERL